MTTIEDDTLEKPHETMLLFVEREETFELIQKIAAETTTTSPIEHRLETILGKYLECPTLLDGSLEEMVVQLGEQWLVQPSSTAPLTILYALCNVRGRKVVQRFLPHAVRTIGPVWEGLQSCYRESRGEQNTISWKRVYCLWLWMGSLSRIPFDSSLVLVSSNGEPGDGCSRLIALAQERALCDAGPVREVAAVTIASWLARPDWETRFLPAWIDWVHATVKDESTSELVRMGALHSVVTLLKVATCERNTLSTVLQPLSNTLASIPSSARSTDLMDQYLVKWWTRWSCWHLSPRPRRNQRSKEPLYSNPTLASTDELWEIPSFIEDAMDHCIYKALVHRATRVRWSGAKGIGRIAERLPTPAIEDVVEAVIALGDEQGSCLALAELARRGCLHHKHVGLVPLTVVVRHPSPVVRDASCYLYWALCRSYPPEVLAPYLPAWNAAMVVTALLDREVNCRRAAAAAFQEAVGRQGARNVPNGIDILTAADYFTLGNRTNAYTVVAVQVAKLSEFYRRAILRQIYTGQLFHADMTIRTLSSKALHALAPLDSDYTVSTIVPYLIERCLDHDVKIRHGSILATAECMLALSECGSVVKDTLAPSLIVRIVAITPALEKQRLYRGRGGEYVRLAASRLIECIALCSIPLSVKDQVRLLDSVDANIPHPNEEIQREACAALSVLMEAYFPVCSTGPSERLQKRVVDKFVQQIRTSSNPAVTRGYCMALGHLPAKLVAPSDHVFATVVDCLRDAAKPTSMVGGEGDAETRRTALQSLRRLIDTVGVNILAAESNSSSCHARGIFKSFLLSLDDYKTDRRGDVGSWCRMEAMTGVAYLILATGKSGNEGIDIIDLITTAVAKILRQLVEKLDTVREKAGKCIEQLLSSADITFAEKKFLARIIGSANGGGTKWRNTRETFSRVLPAARLPVFRTSILSGFAASIGGLSGETSSIAGETLVRWLKGSTGDERNAVGMCYVDILRAKAEGSRLSVPILKTLEILFTRGCFNKSDPLVTHDSLIRSCLEEVQSSLVRTKTIQQPLASVDLLTAIVGSLSVEDPCRKKGLSVLCSLLMHPFPRVRSFAADHMMVLDDMEFAMPYLAETHWKSESFGDKDRHATVSSIATILQVEFPTAALADSS